jgi:RNA polymerase sigma factor (sigma-70 family)
MNDAELIESFVKERAETAFQSLVERHLPLVIGTARRITGDQSLAEEVAQTVFILLARKAASFRQGIIVSGWLYRTTCFVAARALRGERRRQRREQEAVAMQTQIDSEPASAELTAHLDHALQRLSRRERDAVLLRFFDQRPLPEVSSTLGISEDAAKKRVTRALEKLRHFFRGRGSQITSTAIIIALAHESAKASVNTAIISKVTTTALAPTASSALLSEILAAWRWAKIKVALGVGSGAVATALIVSHTITIPTASHNQATQQINQSLAARGNHASISSAPTSDTPASDFQSIEFAGQSLPAHPLRITVLDAVSGKPIAGAQVTHTLRMPRDLNAFGEPLPLRTDSNGVVVFAVPDHFPGDERFNQFQAYIHARGYAPRDIMWLSSTGSVLNIVTNGYTVRLEAGLTIAGTVLDEAGQPLEGVRVGALGNNYLGYSISTDGNGRMTTVLRVEDFSSFGQSSEKADASTSDRSGRFQFEHFPSDLKAVMIDLIGQDGSRRKFRTPQGKRLGPAEDLPEVPFQDLLAGAARLTLPYGTTVQGVVMNAAGDPVPGATVSEGTQWGNLKILSTSDTDFAGRFWLSNRPSHEIILAASADGYGSASTIVAVKPGMAPARIQLPPELPLKARVVNQDGESVAGADIQLPDYLNNGLGLTWKGTTGADGRFLWRSAPTNEVALAIAAQDYPPRLVRLQASTNELLVTLYASHNNGSAYVTGAVADAISGKPVEYFTVQVRHSNFNTLHNDQAAQGIHGGFSLTTSQSQVPVGTMPDWSLLVQADGYEPYATRSYAYEEGDENLDIKLQPGGTIEGIVRNPQRELAIGSQVAVTALGEKVNSYQAGELAQFHPSDLERTDSNGHFKITKPVDAAQLVVFDESGWAMVDAKSPNTDIRLLPWGHIVGSLKSGDEPLTNAEIELSDLVMDSDVPVLTLRSTTTDGNGRFEFNELPAGEYQVGLEPGSWQHFGQPSVEALQTAVKVSAGRTNYVVLRDSGRTVTAQLLLEPSPVTNWEDCSAMLNRIVAFPPAPSRANFITDSSYSQARFRYLHDAAMVAAKRLERSYGGSVSSRGAVVFENIPPGNYLLDVKLFAKTEGNDANAKITAQLSTAVAVPESGAQNTNAVALGSFTLEEP